MTREEAKASLEKIRMHFLFSGNFWEDTKSEVSEAIDLAIEALSAEAVQGEWVKHKGKWVDFDFYPTKYECNQCHYYVDEGCDSIFCPNCGAKMKGGNSK